MDTNCLEFEQMIDDTQSAEHRLMEVKTVDVASWLRGLALANTSKSQDQECNARNVFARLPPRVVGERSHVSRQVER